MFTSYHGVAEDVDLIEFPVRRLYVDGSYLPVDDLAAERWWFLGIFTFKIIVDCIVYISMRLLNLSIFHFVIKTTYLPNEKLN
jgi:hypothetical protein